MADRYDALISRRVHKPALSHEAAIAIIVGMSAANTSTRKSPTA